MIRTRLTLLGAPLKRTYVSHFDFFRWPQTMFFITDDNGNVTIRNQTGNGPNGTIDLTVYAQNPAVRILDGANIIGPEVSHTFRGVRDRSTLNINTNLEMVSHFRVMDACYDVYNTVFRQFAPFNGRFRRAFPFGRGRRVLDTRKRLPRIECRFPDNIFAPQLAWVEAHGITTAFPILHIRSQASDARLFGDSNSPASLLPHEFAHAIHFAQQPQALRVSFEAGYAAWITGRLTSGQPPFHNTNLATDPMVALIEAFGLFSERFFFFSKMNPGLRGLRLHNAFIRDELSPSPSLRTVLNGYQSVGRANGLTITPSLRGDNVEGAVYGAIFLDLARRIRLSRVVNLFLRSRALGFDDFRNFVIRRTNFDNQVIAVANTWGM